MTKTIEEEIRTYAQMCSFDEAGYIAIEKAVQFGIDLHTSLPLSQRLTDEEMERIKKMYMQAIKDWIGVGDARGYCRTCIALEEIFGKELFGEGEGC